MRVCKVQDSHRDKTEHCACTNYNTHNRELVDQTGICLMSGTTWLRKDCPGA